MDILKNGRNIKITYFFAISSEREREKEFYTKDQHDKIEKTPTLLCCQLLQEQNTSKVAREAHDSNILLNNFYKQRKTLCPNSNPSQGQP